ncbi:hypothetical protein M3Y97_01139600 [Aphelenchoides bicaudatus]|nr:hypothetical protein M3Y97_01139600 [Aphelenchoides bicaudatus]
MKTLGVFSLLAVIGLASAGCLDSDNNFTIDSFSFGDYSVSNYHKVQLWQDSGNDISVPNRIYSYIQSALNYTQDGFVYGVPCDGDYPDLVFTFNGQELHIPSSDWVDQDLSFEGICETEIDSFSAVTGFDFNLPNKYEDQICQILNGSSAKKTAKKPVKKQVKNASAKLAKLRLRRQQRKNHMKQLLRQQENKH